MTIASAGTVAAVDLGATSGRVMLGRVDGRGAGTLELQQVARFPNGPVRLASGLTSEQVVATINELEARVKGKNPQVHWQFVEPDVVV